MKREWRACPVYTKADLVGYTEADLMAHKGQRGEQGSVHTDKKTDMTVVKATCGGKRGK